MVTERPAGKHAGVCPRRSSGGSHGTRLPSMDRREQAGHLPTDQSASVRREWEKASKFIFCGEPKSKSLF